jgi:tetratricopeptide (TPR) repeat protein
MLRNKPEGPVRRWAHERAGSGVDAELGEVFRAAAREEPMSELELVRVGRRLRAGAGRRSRPLFRLVPIVLAVLTGSAGAALAQWLKPDIWEMKHVLGTRVELAPPVAPAGAAPRKAPVPVAGQPGASPAPSAAQAQAPEPEPQRVAPAGEVTFAPSGLSRESESLQKALEKLRRDHDGVGALQLLDEHHARFPSGVLALEAAVARIDALLLLGRRADALEHLARLPLARVGRRMELQLLRGELYAERDCRKALADFDAVLAAAPAPLSERALYGRATCRLRSGDAAGGRADLDQYLTRFPSGRFAPQVRQHLRARE